MDLVPCEQTTRLMYTDVVSADSKKEQFLGTYPFHPYPSLRGLPHFDKHYEELYSRKQCVVLQVNL